MQPALVQLSFVVQATLSPGESALVTVVGTGVLKMFKVADQTLKPLPLSANRRDTLSFTCQTWVPLGDKGGDGAGAAASGAGETAKPGTIAASSGAAAGTDRERQLMGTVDGEILLFEVGGREAGLGSAWLLSSGSSSLGSNIWSNWYRHIAMQAGLAQTAATKQSAQYACVSSLVAADCGPSSRLAPVRDQAAAALCTCRMCGCPLLVIRV